MRQTSFLETALLLLLLFVHTLAVRQVPTDVEEKETCTEEEGCLTWRKLTDHQFLNNSDYGPLTYDHVEGEDTYWFATAAYCTANNIDQWDSGRKFQKHPNIIFPKAYNTTIPLFWGMQNVPLEFFTAYYEEENRIILSFKGTVFTSIASWVNDFLYAFSAPPRSWGWPEHQSIYIERGFTRAWDELRIHAFEQVLYLAKKYPDATLVTTGHSLGAALATLAAADIRIQGMIEKIKVYVFGSPRVGNLSWAVFYNDFLRMRNSTFRITNGRDPVPHIPFTGVTFFRGYHHVGIETWYSSYNYTQCNRATPLEECKISSFCTYNEDQNCSMSLSICLTPTCVSDHTHYFDVMSSDHSIANGC